MKLEKIGAELPPTAGDLLQRGWCRLTSEQLAIFVDFLLHHHRYLRRALSPPLKADLSAKTAISDPTIVLQSLWLTLQLVNSEEHPLKALDDLLDDLKAANVLTEDAVSALRPCLTTLTKDYPWTEPAETLFASYVPVYAGSSSRCVVTPEFEITGPLEEIDLEKYIPTVKALIPAVLLRLRSVTSTEENEPRISITPYLLTELDIDNLIKRLQVAKKQLSATAARLGLTDADSE